MFLSILYDSDFKHDVSINECTIVRTGNYGTYQYGGLLDWVITETKPPESVDGLLCTIPYQNESYLYVFTYSTTPLDQDLIFYMQEQCKKQGESAHLHQIENTPYQFFLLCEFEIEDFDHEEQIVLRDEMEDTKGHIEYANLNVSKVTMEQTLCKQNEKEIGVYCTSG